MAAAVTFRLPLHNHRTAVMGRTGSGKTVMGLFLLSGSNFEQKPYYIVDYKGDPYFQQIDRLREIGLHERPPTNPGLYVIRPIPKADDEAVNDWLLRIWEQENAGIMFDEAYMVPEDRGFISILTQGRTKHINSIINTQRPAWISRFVFTEANQLCAYHLNDKDDRKKLWRHLPEDKVVRQRLPDYHSIWYDVDRNELSLLGMVPHPDVLLDRIQTRLQPRRVTI